MVAPELGTMLIGMLPVVLAGAWGVVNRPQWLIGLRGAALGAVIVVVLFGILPDVLGVLGPSALLASVVGYALPALFERLLSGRSGAWVAAVGVGAHQLLHGAEIGALSGTLGTAGLLAMGSHALPIVAIVLVDARDAWGHRAARALWLIFLLLTAVGLVLGGWIPVDALGTSDQWLQAFVAGLLIHVTTHGTARADLLGAPMIVGIVLGVVGALALV